MAEAAPAVKRVPKTSVRLLFFVWFLLVAVPATAGFVVLMLEEPDRGLGFGLLTLALVVQFAVGWRVRWMQKRGRLGPAPSA